MDVNNPVIMPAVRGISGRCYLNGVSVQFKSFDVVSNGFRGASTFSVELAVSGLPANMQLSWWAAQTTITVELWADIKTASGTDSKSLIKGNIDTWDFDPARFVITCDGRDFAALFIDAKTAGETFKNYTSSQIAEILAKRQGLKSSVKPTASKFGEFYQIDSAHLTGEQTEWDLLITLAGLEDYSVWVEGDTLYFQPEANQMTGDNYVIHYQPPGVAYNYPQANVSEDLRFSRALTISKGVTVEVMSWSAKRKNKQFTAYYPKKARGATPGASTPKTQVYRIIRNGLTPEQAQTLAEKIYRDIVLHELKFSCSTAGDNLLTPRTLVRIEGTGSLFDQEFWCDSVTRHMSWDNGYVMSVTGKNHSPALEITAE
ncbi:TPA: type IV secretion protein Rhs [Citrobacter murliniae]